MKLKKNIPHKTKFFFYKKKNIKKQFYLIFFKKCPKPKKNKRKSIPKS